MAESFSRQKSRHAPQKEGGLKILCDLPPVYVQNGREENTHTLPDYSGEVIERLQNLFYGRLIHLALEFDVH